AGPKRPPNCGPVRTSPRNCAGTGPPPRPSSPTWNCLKARRARLRSASMPVAAADDDHLYRRGVGIMLLNRDGKVFVAARVDNPADAWQMPQGGLDEDEAAWDAALRELEEETGIKPD